MRSILSALTGPANDQLIPAAKGLLGVVVLYALLGWVLPSESLFCGDQGAKLLQVRGVLQRDWRGEVDYPGRIIDPGNRWCPWNHPSFFQREGRYYGKFSLLWAWLSAPFYRLWGLSGLRVLPLLSGLLMGALVMYAAARNLGKTAGWGLVLAMGTPVFFYSMVFWEHTLAAVLILGSVLLLGEVLKEGERSGWAMGAGLLAGGAVWLRLETAVFLLGLVGALAGSPGPLPGRLKRLALLGLGAGIIGLPFFLVNQGYFGHPLGPHAAIEFSRERGAQAVLAHRWEGVRTFLLPRQGAFWILGSLTLLLAGLVQASRGHSASSRGARGLLLGGLVGIGLFSFLYWSAVVLEARELFPGLCRITTTLLGGSPGSDLFATDLLTTCPLLALGFLGWLPAAPRAARLAANLSFFFIALTCLIAPVHGGSQWGPRFLLPVHPLLVLAAAGGLGALPHGLKNPPRSWRMVTISLLILSLGSQLIGAAALYIVRRSNAHIGAVTRRLPAEIIVTDFKAFPNLMAPLSGEKIFLSVQTREDLEALVGRLSPPRFQRARVAYVTRREKPRREGIDLEQAQHLWERHFSLCSREDLAEMKLSFWVWTGKGRQ